MEKGRKKKKMGKTTNDGNEGNVYTNVETKERNQFTEGLMRGKGGGEGCCEVDKQVSKLVIELISSLIKEENPSWFFPSPSPSFIIKNRKERTISHVLFYRESGNRGV